MKQMTKIEKYISELGWILFDPKLLDAVRMEKRTKGIIRKRFVQGWSREEVAEHYDYSIERIRKLELEGFEELKAMVSASILFCIQVDFKNMQWRRSPEMEAAKAMEIKRAWLLPMETNLRCILDVKPKLLQSLADNGIHTLHDLVHISAEQFFGIPGLTGQYGYRLLEDLQSAGIEPSWYHEMRDPKWRRKLRAKLRKG